MYTTLINTHDLADIINDEHVVIVDCRFDLSDVNAGYRKYLDSHVKGAIYASLSHDLSGPPVTDHGRHPMPTPERMINTFSAMGINDQSQVVIYDDSFGAVAARLWWMLRFMGHRAVAVLDGGWQAWMRDELNVESGETRNAAVNFEGKPDTPSLVLLNQVVDAGILVDSREPDRYTGKVEPIDPVAGHIPSAVNYYWKENLGEQGEFLPGHLLKEKLLDLFRDKPPAQAVFYCGSGVTACHNLLATAHAGLAGPRLYAGSWSEWCNEPGLAVETGGE